MSFHYGVQINRLTYILVFGIYISYLDRSRIILGSKKTNEKDKWQKDNHVYNTCNDMLRLS